MGAERIRYQKRIQSIKREQARLNHQDDRIDDGFLSSESLPQPTNFDLSLQLATEALRSRLIDAGTNDPWLLSRAGIYQRAISRLSIILTRSPLSDQLQQAAKWELNMIAQTLIDLFTGQIKLHTTINSNDYATFSGYYRTTDEKSRRLSIRLIPEGGYSQLVNRSVRGNCQFFINDILGQSAKGRAIATKNDAPLRIGLRCSGPTFNPYWAISINAGKAVSEGREHPSLETVRPLSQAIQECKSSPEGFYYLQDDEYSTTYHFNDPTSQLDNPQETRLHFNEFMHNLRLVFQQMARPSANPGAISRNHRRRS